MQNSWKKYWNNRKPFSWFVESIMLRCWSNLQESRIVSWGQARHNLWKICRNRWLFSHVWRTLWCQNLLWKNNKPFYIHSLLKPLPCIVFYTSYPAIPWFQKIWQFFVKPLPTTKEQWCETSNFWQISKSLWTNVSKTDQSCSSTLVEPWQSYSASLGLLWVFHSFTRCNLWVKVRASCLRIEGWLNQS